MNPEELRAWRVRMGLTIESASERLPCGARTWAHWEGGTRGAPRMLLRALRDMERELAAERAPGRLRAV